ncbi:hypothetical protein [Microbulbifer spongiae]|uniref:Uncharacterized protein n=1 Tax=Microbulbifer spongiae TaxID=2944933 RepID=A0ABY9ECC8_9GAMM|nr:hypothetical protein [Microbulbifer sp. MI-G]WKD48426.1 hypothetical protein M8T91_10855 [Microbulbifer sp. MI-G]
MNNSDTPLSSLLTRARNKVEQALRELKPPYTLFFSISDATQRAQVKHINAQSFSQAWKNLADAIQIVAAQNAMEPCWLRVDWVIQKSITTLCGLHKLLEDTKRCHFRYGIALDIDCNIAFLEQELNGNAMLDEGGRMDHAILNEKEFRSYTNRRFGPQVDLDFSEERTIVLLSTKGLFCEHHREPVYLYGPGPDAGRRTINTLNCETVTQLIEDGSRYLISQLKPNGSFYKGWYACFDRAMSRCTALEHASAVYTMIETWKITKCASQLSAIQHSLDYMTKKLLRVAVLESGKTGAFVVEPNGEIRLGSNAVCLLALVNYSQVRQTSQYAEWMTRLARGIELMQAPTSGRFFHAVEYPALTVKDCHRVIDYDGQAVLGLLRLYGFSKHSRWLAVADKAFNYLLTAGHWRAHNVWLGYCVNELTAYRPDERYYQFGIRNFAGHLGVMEQRIIPSPILLQSMTAADTMITRLRQEGQFQYLLDQVDLTHFYQALHRHTTHLLNGYFWPEFALFFKNPTKILGSFYTRHHAFRIHIDDVGHYLCALVAYHKYLHSHAGDHLKAPCQPRTSNTHYPHWNKKQNPYSPGTEMSAKR